MRILCFKWFGEDELYAELGKSVEITEEEYESLKSCRGFPHELEEVPEWVEPVDPKEDPYNRPSVEGEPDATIIMNEHVEVNGRE